MSVQARLLTQLEAAVRCTATILRPPVRRQRNGYERGERRWGADRPQLSAAASESAAAQREETAGFARGYHVFRETVWGVRGREATVWDRPGYWTVRQSPDPGYLPMVPAGAACGFPRAAQQRALVAAAESCGPLDCHLPSVPRCEGSATVKTAGNDGGGRAVRSFQLRLARSAAAQREETAGFARGYHVFRETVWGVRGREATVWDRPGYWTVRQSPDPGYLPMVPAGAACGFPRAAQQRALVAAAESCGPLDCHLPSVPRCEGSATVKTAGNDGGGRALRSFQLRSVGQPPPSGSPTSQRSDEDDSMPMAFDVDEPPPVLVPAQLRACSQDFDDLLSVQSYQLMKKAVVQRRLIGQEVAEFVGLLQQFTGHQQTSFETHSGGRLETKLVGDLQNFLDGADFWRRTKRGRNGCKLIIQVPVFRGAARLEPWSSVAEP